MNEIAAINPTGVEVQAAETMPHSIEAEQQLLGAILTNNEVYDRIATLIGPQHFYDPVHARIFETAAARIAKKVQVRFAWENIVVLAALAAIAVVVSVLVRRLRRWRLKGPKPKRESNGIALAASDAARSSTAS